MSFFHKYQKTDTPFMDIAEEHRIWRKNVPHYYDLLITHTLTWPSLTVQWYPTADRVNNSTVQNILLSTHTSGAEKEYLIVAGVSFPDSGQPTIRTVMEIPIQSETNKARHSTTSMNVIACRSDDPETTLYDVTKHHSSSDMAQPDCILTGHTKGGFGLSFSRTGAVATSGVDGNCFIYDIMSAGNLEVSPTASLKGHVGAVGDVCFSMHNNLIATVGDDKRVIIHDTRSIQQAVSIENAHASDVFACHWSPVEDNLLASASKDGFVAVWDSRSTKNSLCKMYVGGEVLQVQWSPHLGSFLAAAGSDRRVRIYDINQLNMVNPNTDESNTKTQGSVYNEDQENPMLKFVHGGHTNTVCDFSWNPLEPMEICSVADDNILQIWQTTLTEIPFEIDED